MDFRNTGRLRELVKKISKTLIHEGDLWGRSPPGHLRSPGSHLRPQAIDEIIKRISGAGLKPTEISRARRVPKGERGALPGHVAFSTMYDFLKNLEAVRDRRKAVIYISDGYDFNPFATSRTSYQNEMYGRTAQGPDRSQRRERAAAERGRQPFDKQVAVRGPPTGAEACRVDARGQPCEQRRSTRSTRAGWWAAPTSTRTSTKVECRLHPEVAGACGCWRRTPAASRVVNQNDFDRGLKRTTNETATTTSSLYSSTRIPPSARESSKIKVSGRI